MPTTGTPAAAAAGTVQPRLAGTGDRDGDMSLRLYLREISETPLLTIQDEIDLAGRIQKGDAAAREHMITANLRLVVKIARDYEGMGLPLLDMVNEGNMGLMRAVERFDPTKGAKLSTYAAWWIKQSIKRGIANQGKTIRLPVHLVDRVAKIRRAALKLHEELGREPSEAEIAEAMGMKAERVGELLAASCRPASLDAPVGDDDDTRFADLVRDENSTTAFECLDESSRHDMVLELIERLDQREIAVIRERFGLNGRSERTLEQIGQRFGVTRERIRQIEAGALRKLRKLVERREAQVDPDLDSFREAA
jgi:RNA polymerase primary sigma factor